MRISCVNLVYSYSPLSAANAGGAEEVPDEIDVVPDAPESTASDNGPPILSLRQMQRSWLALGYRKTKTKGSNAIGIKYAAPWKGAHFANASGRVQCEGINSRPMDRVLLKYRTCRYIRELDTATGRHYRLARPMCQNMVAKCYMPAPRQLCIGLVHASHKDISSFTAKFNNVVVRNPANIKPKGPSLLVYAHGKVLCVGARSVDAMLRTFASLTPLLKRSYRTDANLALEQQYMDAAIVSQYRLPPRVAAKIRKAQDEDERAEEEEQEAAAASSSGRDCKIRVMGYVL
jgi:hypothetical protein